MRPLKTVWLQLIQVDIQLGGYFKPMRLALRQYIILSTMHHSTKFLLWVQKEMIRSNKRSQGVWNEVNCIFICQRCVQTNLPGDIELETSSPVGHSPWQFSPKTVKTKNKLRLIYYSLFGKRECPVSMEITMEEKLTNLCVCLEKRS